mmetsp:Transcript_37014/g.92130  ORF Transcript_37014/g.92130 Transcript_37014/m.92130 type:complete len:141 (-) Transcript_37014:121-543(-)
MDGDEAELRAGKKKRPEALPKALIAKLVQAYLLPNMTCTPRAIEAMGECVDEFLRALSSESSAVCDAEKKKTILPEHIGKALRQLEFTAYADAIEHEELRSTAVPRKRARASDSALSKEELEKQQKALFDEARAAAAAVE